MKVMSTSRVLVVAAAMAAACVGGDCTQETPVPLKLVGSRGIAWSNGVGQSTDGDPQVLYALPTQTGKPCGIRIRFVITTSDGSPAYLQAFWTKDGAGFMQNPESSTFASSPHEQTFIVKLDGEADTLRVDPDAKAGTSFKLLEIVLITQKRS